VSAVGLLIASALLLLLGGALAYLGPRRRAVALLHAAAIVCFIVLTTMFLAADAFTGRGIDESVLYHATYGLGGAGFGEYAPQIAAVVLVLAAGGGAAVAFARSLLRSRPGKALPTGHASTAVALLACAFNPATRDLARVFQLRERLGLTDIDGRGVSSFDAYYRKPDIGRDPRRRRNLVFIYAEGLEQTYMDEALFPGLMVGLRGLRGSSTVFTDVQQTTGTSFTIGGVVGSQCGIPLVTASHGNSMSGMNEFLPEARCLGDLLASRGYHLAYLGGADLKFAGKGKFLNGHGFKEVLGRDELLPTLKNPSYRSSWGLHDDSLLDIAYDKFTQLAAGAAPFGLFLLTLDTHHPNGHVSQATADIQYEGGRTPILNAVAGSDRLLARFVERLLGPAKETDTLIVVASDHLALSNGATKRLERGERRMLFMLIDPRRLEHTEIRKPGTTLDIGPTVLHALGYDGEIGLGRNLLGREGTLREALPSVDAALNGWRRELSDFWGVSLDNGVAVNARGNGLTVGGRVLRMPAMLAFDEDLNVDVFLPKSHAAGLLEHVRGLKQGSAFLLVDGCTTAELYTGKRLSSWRNELCVMAARRGGEPLFLKRAKEVETLSRLELEAVLATPVEAGLHAAQSARLLEPLLPKGLPLLAETIPMGSVIFASKTDRSRRDAKTYFQLSSASAKNVEWTHELPEGREFFFAAPSLQQVRKSSRYDIERLALGDDLATILEDAPETVILALRGDIDALSEPTLERLERLGLQLDRKDRAASFAAVLHRGKVIAQALSSAGPVLLEGDALAALGIDRVASGGRQHGDQAGIGVGGKEISRNARGLNIAILRRREKPQVLAIDTHITERARADVFKATPIPLSARP
jgi:phosphoglycerol transferase